MTKTIGKYDFVKTKGSNSYYFIRDIYDDKATIVGMKLSENKDTIMFYSKQVPVDELTYVTEYFVNTNGPLAILRENIMNGQDDFYIEGL